MSRIIVVAHHPIVLKGICDVINEKTPSYQIIDTATDIKSFLSQLKFYKPDAAVIDVSVTWKSEIDLLDEIHHIHPSMQLHFVSIHPFDQSVQEYLSNKVKNRFHQKNTDSVNSSFQSSGTYSEFL